MAFNIYKWRRDQLLTENEEKSTVVTKKIKDLTFKDVEGLALPTKTATLFANMKLDHNLDSWRKAFSKEEQELEVTIDKDNKMWSDKVKIEDITQSDPMGFQAKIDAEKGKKSGLDEALFLYSDEEMKKGASPKEYTDKEIEDMSLEAAKKLYKGAKNNWNVPHNHKLANRLRIKIEKADPKYFKTKEQ